LLAIAAPTATTAQSGTPTPGSGSLRSSTFHVDFGAHKDARPKMVQPLNRSLNPVPPIKMGTNPVDCAIVKRVDPHFESNMPIVKPDPKMQLPMKTIQPPACKG